MLNPRISNRVKNALLVIVISSTLALTSCGKITNFGKEAPQLSNLTISLDTSYKGTLTSYSDQKVLLGWDVKGDSAYSNKTKGEKYLVEMNFGNEKFEKEVIITPINDTQGNRSLVLDLDSKFTESSINALFAIMAQSSPNTTFTFTVKILQEGENEENVIKSEVSNKWIRPQVSQPADPIISYEWKYQDSTEPCVLYEDIAVHSFNAYPSLKTVGIFTGAKKDSDVGGVNKKNLDSFLSVNCHDKGGVSLKIVTTLSNVAGTSNQVIKIIKSLTPGRTDAEVENEKKADKIAGCSNKLKVNELSAAIGDCGYIKIEVLQSDLDTGSCNFLGYWTEANGAKKIGLFEYCSAFTAGSIDEDSTYTLYVRVDGPTTYTSRLGTNRSVLSFTVITDK